MREYRKTNREKLNEYMREYFKRPDVKEKSREYRQKNREKKREYMREYRKRKAAEA